MINSKKVARHIEIRTERLDENSYLEDALDKLEVEHSTIEKHSHLNMNVSKGFGETKVTEADVATFKRFMNRLPNDTRRQLTYFNDYEPNQLL